MEEESGGPPNPSVMELDMLDKKIRRLVCKLKRFNIDLEVFSHEAVEYGSLLGKGGEGMVRKCTVLYNGVKVEAAAKTVIDNSEDAVSITLDEIELLCLANDPIINTTQTVYGVVAEPCEEDAEYGRLVIITEAGLMNALQLYQEEPVPLHVTLELWSRLAAALHTMHSKKIIHQDLKPENILVTAINRDKFGQICKIDFKVIDLGMAKRVYTEKIVTDDILGTNGYHAPEVLFDESYDFRADIYMLGISFCVMLHSPEFLKSTELQTLLKELHAAKQKKMAGEELFKAVVKRTLGGYTELPDAISDMICTMLETAESRDVTLLQISDLCRETSDELRDNGGSEMPLHHAAALPVPAPLLSGGADSGFECGGDNMLSGNQGVEAECDAQNKPTNMRRRLRRGRRAAATSNGDGAQSPSPSRETSGRSSCSVFSVQSEINGTMAKRMTRSQSVTSVASDITVCSDISDLRRTRAASRKQYPTRASRTQQAAGIKRLRSDSKLPEEDERLPPARRCRTRFDYRAFFD